MARVTFGRVLLYEPQSKTLLRLQSTDVQQQIDTGGQVRRYANGRRRSVRPPGWDKTLPLTFVDVADTDRDHLQSWAGRILLYRDPVGRKVWGVYHDPKTLDYHRNQGRDISVTFQQVTWDESV